MACAFVRRSGGTTLEQWAPNYEGMMKPMSRSMAVVMAAGKGTRMQSDLPKVLVPVCNRPMVEYVLDALAAGGVDDVVVVVGYRADDVKTTLNRPQVQFALQEPQQGTGHAVMMCREALANHDGPVVVLAGDSPMIRRQSIARLLEEYERGRPACILGTGHKEDPKGLGRIVRDARGKFAAIVEEKDATDAQRQLTEVNLSCYVFDCKALLAALERLRPDNAQKEYYITDCPRIMLEAGQEVRALDILQPSESLSINNMEELAAVEAAMRSGVGQ
jgi:bifunctional UDP-N-acetylglucosamine pyrophosphorylase/glucosamine-1-phosphate N-acetyltransferase/UDP-N-acetylglucosamine pyrophosphorylase